MFNRFAIINNDEKNIVLIILFIVNISFRLCAVELIHPKQFWQLQSKNGRINVEHLVSLNYFILNPIYNLMAYTEMQPCNWVTYKRKKFEILENIFAQCNHHELLTRLLADSCQYNNRTFAEFLLHKGARINDKTYNDGYCPLHFAVCNGSIGLVHYLLEQGADINAIDIEQTTPLHYALNCENKPVAQYLIHNGADIHAQDEHQFTPLVAASIKGFKKIVQLLLAKGADINHKDIFNSTPLHSAIINNRNTCVDLLCRFGAQLTAQNDEGYSPLMMAVDIGSYTSVLLILWHALNAKELYQQTDRQGAQVSDIANQKLVLYLLTYALNEITESHHEIHSIETNIEHLRIKQLLDYLNKEKLLDDPKLLRDYLYRKIKKELPTFEPSYKPFYKKNTAVALKKRALTGK